jgi:hypothetical protein
LIIVILSEARDFCYFAFLIVFCAFVHCLWCESIAEYIYIPIFQWWESLFFSCLLFFFPSIFIIPMECIFFLIWSNIS